MNRLASLALYWASEKDWSTAAWYRAPSAGSAAKALTVRMPERLSSATSFDRASES